MWIKMCNGLRGAGECKTSVLDVHSLSLLYYVWQWKTLENARKRIAGFIYNGYRLVEDSNNASVDPTLLNGSLHFTDIVFHLCRVQRIIDVAARQRQLPGPPSTTAVFHGRNIAGLNLV